MIEFQLVDPSLAHVFLRQVQLYYDMSHNIEMTQEKLDRLTIYMIDHENKVLG